VRQAPFDKGLFNANLQTLSGIDIGPTIEWGRPWRKRFLSPARRRAFARYSDFPSRAGSSVDDPVRVLVDGRFRVACALKSLRALRGQEGWTLIVDDYTGRSGYHVMENFATAERFVGRMAVFKSLTLREPSALDDAIRQCERDPA
jgi:hypothetical protein